MDASPFDGPAGCCVRCYRRFKARYLREAHEPPLEPPRAVPVAPARSEEQCRAATPGVEEIARRAAREREGWSPAGVEAWVESRYDGDRSELAAAAKRSAELAAVRAEVEHAKARDRRRAGWGEVVMSEKTIRQIERLHELAQARKGKAGTPSKWNKKTFMEPELRMED